MNQSQLAELFDTSVPNISMHIYNILKENELQANSVIKDYLTTAQDGKNYNVTFYAHFPWSVAHRTPRYAQNTTIFHRTP
jgi:hypothetical protein